MKKMRVYEYAKQSNLTSKEVINHLKDLDIEVSNHMSTINENAIRQLNNKLNDNKSNETKQSTKEQSKTNSNQGKKPNNNSKKNNQAKQQEKKSKHRAKQQKGKHNKNNNQKQNQQQPTKTDESKKTPEKITYQDTLTVGELAEKLNKDSSEIIKKLMMLGVMTTINQTLEPESIELICEDYGVEVEKEEIIEETDLSIYIEEDDPKDLAERPAVVTIMGHVDHGKTTLLDSIRHTKVTEGEAGGITQHIGAYQIETDGKKVTFLDTPGHAAFTSMRSRGAQVTDIAVLVVAADDGVMPQTAEAINHAKAAEVPIIVAVNKMDKEGADPNRVMQELMEYELVPEDWGGDTIFVPLSALKGDGIDDLLEMLKLVSEVEELKSNADRLADGTVIEAELDKGRGPVATFLVQNGTLKVGDPLVVGNTYGKVRAMTNDIGKRVKEAGPSMPVEVIGLQDVPQAGDRFVVFGDEKDAKRIAELRKEKEIESQREESGKVNLDELFKHIQEGDIKEINVILKADVQGTVEALASSLQKIEVEGAKIKIIHTGVGAITESDIILASASNAIIIGFNVRPDANAKRTAEAENIDIRLHRIIYKVIEEMEAAMKGVLDPEYEEKVIGQAEVRETFKVSKVGTIAGSYVTDGKITRHSGVRVIRDSVVQFEGEIDSLKRYKDDVKEVQQGYECGITVVNYNDIKVGDIIEAFVMEEIER
ncbi:translation initiation factor IF-2 [Tenuibacillus multivorans]|uniref:Translation initiation factor IF-2 n=1 Tax=Tenuibacillus multivorans TaxID=237069 RepID=A0A1G9XVH2_9BACI|nr:translation initiation factor IF-2 [Tenuibacillus multivorans]GEL75835.1 translation initiation factor IF-2 [Tenuibacillus multivorans]SDN00832.1 translation initiation factor IF-2 [Tenuibacillus multivorans]